MTEPADPRTGADPAAADPEEAAWAELRARWQDDGAHRAFLGRFGDLAGLARAGARYREAIAASPDDPVARRWRDEVLRRAAVWGLAAMPRVRPPERSSRWVKLAAAWAAGAVAVAAAAWAVTSLWRGGRGP